MPLFAFLSNFLLTFSFLLIYNLNMSKTNIIWLLFFLSVFAICVFVWNTKILTKKGSIAVITVNGQLYRKIDLKAVDEPYCIEINNDYGYNKILVEKDKISVTEADCPDKVCMKTGPISSAGRPIVCLPHKLSITIEDEEGVDTFSGR